MRWYKFSIVLAIGLFVELAVAAASCLLVKENGEWLASLTLPYFAPHSPLFYGAMTEVAYLFSALALACYASNLRALRKGVLLTAAEGSAEIVTMLFFFKFTYEITSFFLATATMLFSVYLTADFLSKKDVAGIVRFPVLAVHLYLWMILYCILTINFV